jgi:hypothetical protein
MVSKTDFWQAVVETVVFTFTEYGYTNVDTMYLDIVAGLLSTAYPNIPEGLDWRRALFNMFHKYTKKHAKVRSHLSPLASPNPQP